MQMYGAFVNASISATQQIMAQDNFVVLNWETFAVMLVIHFMPDFISNLHLLCYTIKSSLYLQTISYMNITFIRFFFLFSDFYWCVIRQNLKAW